jgi:hypothetical protein
MFMVGAEPGYEPIGLEKWGGEVAPYRPHQVTYPAPMPWLTLPVPIPMLRWQLPVMSWLTSGHNAS